MTDRTLCDRFVECVDAFITGSLPIEEEREFRTHIQTCGDCKALLRLYHHTNENVPARTGSSMPAGLDADMWQRVSNALPESQKSVGRERKRLRSWFMPLLAAAAAVLLFMNGYLMAELRHYRQREERIVSHFENLDRGFERLPDGRIKSGIGTVKLTGYGQTMLQYRPDQGMSINEWIQILSRIPGETTVLFITEIPRDYTMYTKRYGMSENQGFEIKDGIQVHEAISILESTFDDPNRKVTLRQLMDGIPSTLRNLGRGGEIESVMLQSSKGD